MIWSRPTGCIVAGIAMPQANRAGPYTDPRWRPEDGGLSEPRPRVAGRVDAYDLRVDEERAAARGWRSDTCAAGAPGVSGTITPPPYDRAEIQHIRDQVAAALASLDRLLERQL